MRGLRPSPYPSFSYRFDHYARECVKNRTASSRYKQGRFRALETYLNPALGNCDIRSVG